MTNDQLLTIAIALYTALSILAGSLPESRFVRLMRAILIDVKKFGEEISRKDDK